MAARLSLRPSVEEWKPAAFTRPGLVGRRSGVIEVEEDGESLVEEGIDVGNGPIVVMGLGEGRAGFSCVKMGALFVCKVGLESLC